MKLGVVFPQTEIGPDPGPIRDYAHAVEEAGYDFLCAYDHVLGANPERPGGWDGPYTHRTQFHEVLVLLGYIAALTERIELVSEILILPQRQTALVAKQAAEVDVLSRGRLRLGVGLGWNRVEYDALGMSFSDRGRRIEEQVAVLRRLWADELVTVDGQWHHVDDAGLNPLPPRRRIPVWMGGTADAALRRVARIADGWMVNIRTMADVPEAVDRVSRYVAEAGRDPAAFGIAGRVSLRGGTEQVLRDLDAWRATGVSHCSINTMGAGIDTPAGHVAALREIASAQVA